DAIKWLLQSPFDRSDGLRQKVIVVANQKDSTNENIKKLQSSGFQVVSTDNLDGVQVVDVFVVTGNTLSTADIKQFAEKQGKIIWTENEIDNETANNVQTEGLELISGKNIYSEALRIRE